MPDFSTKQREELAKKKEAMPNGAYPIRNVADLKRAIQAYGRAKDKAATKKWIIKRAKELGREDLIPESWKESLAHYGVKGMKWGVRKKRPSAKKMTTKDLSTKVNRMRLESEYNKYTRPKRTRAKMIGASVLTAVATTAATMAVRKYAGKGSSALSALKKPAAGVAETIWDLPLSEWEKAMR